MVGLQPASSLLSLTFSLQGQLDLSLLDVLGLIVDLLAW